jgi:glycosyltransferase involved in cell wall biosynthesis
MSGPLRVLELRSVRGTGGGPEKTIVNGALHADRDRVHVTVCYIRDARDERFGIDARVRNQPIDYVEIRERHSFDPAVWPALVRTIRERDIDIVHAHEYKTDAYALALARATGVIPLATAHGWTGHLRRERHFYYPIDKRLLRFFPWVIAVSGEIRSTLVAAGVRRERIATVLNGIDATAFHRDRTREASAREALGVDHSAIVIGAVGRLEPQKRFDLLLGTVAALRARGRATTAIIAGDGSLRAALEAQAAALDLGNACRVLGHRADVVRLHHGFDLYVQTSDYEGTPNSVLEAMALETPTIATDAGGTSDLIEDGVHGLIAPCGSVPALVEAVERTLADPVRTSARVAAARRRVETELSFERRTRTLEAIYQEVARRRDHPTAAVALHS